MLLVATTCALAVAALLVERAVGYPDALFRRIGHPVTWAGRLIDALDLHLNTAGRTATARRRGGIVVIAALLAAAIALGLPLQTLAGSGLVGFVLAAVLCSSLLAQRSLAEHVAAVAVALETEGLEAGRREVAKIVGRDPDRLDAAGVARAAIESLAENFSDGVVAPALWLAALGPVGGIAYKAINTADSMIGHRTERHASFGRAAARLDDAINLPASRLAALLLTLAAPAAGATMRGVWRVVRRDARRHRSPNAGWPEAAMASALGISLAGPRSYGGRDTSDPEMNAGARRAVAADDIRRALRLYWIADAMLIGLLVAVAAAFLVLALT